VVKRIAAEVVRRSNTNLHTGPGLAASTDDLQVEGWFLARETLDLSPIRGAFFFKSGELYCVLCTMIFKFYILVEWLNYF
jgi:hypothetical protein